MDPITEMAEKLGKAIAESPASAKLRECRKALDGQPEVLQTLKEYQEQAHKVGQLEEQNKPIEVEDKQRLSELHDKLVASDVFKQFTAAQVDFVDVMRKVNTVLRKHLSGIDR